MKESKKIMIIVGAVLCAAFCVWVLLVAGIFKDKKTKPIADPEKGETNVSAAPTATPEAGPTAAPEKKVQVYRKTAEYRVADEGKIPVVTNTYDADGNILTNIRYDEEGKVSSKNEYDYDESGFLKNKNEYDAKGTRFGQTEYMRDEEGILLQERYSTQAGLFSVSQYNFDAKGNLASKQYYYYAAESPYEKEEYLYDDAGNLLEYRIVYRGDSTVRVDRYTYDAENRPLLRSVTDEGKEIGRAEYSYESGKVTVTRFEFGEAVEKTVYDDRENLLENSYMSNTGWYTVQKNEFNPDGKQTSRTSFNPDGSILLREEWKYDGKLLKQYSKKVQGEEGLAETELEEFEYDNSGKLIRELLTNRFPNGAVFSTFEYSFLEEGKMISMIGLNAMGMKIAEEHQEYDEAGNVTSKSQWYRDVAPSQSVFEYAAFLVPESRLTDEEKAALGIETK